MASKKINIRTTLTKEELLILNEKRSFANAIFMLASLISNNTMLFTDKQEGESNGMYLARIMKVLSDMSNAEFRGWLNNKTKEMGYDDKDIVSFNIFDGSATIKEAEIPKEIPKIKSKK